MADLGSVLWIGGPPASGKTSVARLVARRYGLRWYNADARTWEHRDRAIAGGNEAAIRWEAMEPAKRWVAPVEEMLAMSLNRERGPMVADDVRALPDAPLTIVEGTPVTPEIAGDRAVWLMPGADVLEERLDERRMTGGRKELYLALADEIARQIDGARTLTADGDLEETVAQVEEVFADALAEGPVAATVVERRALLRYANRAAVDQHLAFFARPWSPGDARTTVFGFVCECGDPACEAFIDLAIADFPDGPLLSPTH